MSMVSYKSEFHINVKPLFFLLLTKIHMNCVTNYKKARVPIFLKKVDIFVLYW